MRLDLQIEALLGWFCEDGHELVSSGREFLRGDRMAKKVRNGTMNKLRSAILGSAGAGSLYRWLRSHHDELVEMLDQVPRPDWKAIRDALVEENLQDAKGQKPTAERVRQTWVRVRADVKEAREKKVQGQPATMGLSEKVKQSVSVSQKEAPTGVAASGDGAVKDPSADLRMADLRRQMNRRSGRKDDD